MLIWIILSVCLFMVLMSVEEIIYFILRTRVMDEKRPEGGKVLSFYKKMKVKLNASKQESPL
ncbi:hypothetical protein LCM10_03130 [Rossellomorea aquimaris]|uniref:hypothetical protein n=1 Tax=Rossellomorea aquimaris TaxID=189382 RepID=UPI001CD79989|nr:hypothetical protein [Rossellomorea aquimaris]MCA1053968.1 hypothetical protein [Rossellomorea aquimaris]